VRRGPAQQRGPGIGGVRVAQPDVGVEHRDQLRGEKAALGLEMPRALAPHLAGFGEVGAEEHQRFGTHAAILDEAEAQRIDPGAPRDIGRVAPMMHDRIGEARAVHVQG
jgi:hypothetical protein